jgi:hypothetical protein
LKRTVDILNYFTHVFVLKLQLKHSIQ